MIDISDIYNNPVCLSKGEPGVEMVVNMIKGQLVITKIYPPKFSSNKVDIVYNKEFDIEGIKE